MRLLRSVLYAAIPSLDPDAVHWRNVKRSRRRAVRVPVKLVAELSAGARTWKAVVTNLSATGIAIVIESTDVPPAGTPVAVRVLFDEHGTELPGTVKRIALAHQARTVGIEFAGALQDAPAAWTSRAASEIKQAALHVRHNDWEAAGRCLRFVGFDASSRTVARAVLAWAAESGLLDEPR